MYHQIKAGFIPQYAIDAMNVRKRTDTHGFHADFQGYHMTYLRVDDEIKVVSYFHQADPERVSINNYMNGYGEDAVLEAFEALAILEEVDKILFGRDVFEVSK